MKNIENNKLDYEDIRTRINEYTKSIDFNYALLIKGEWGIGKTYFIRNNIIKNLNDDISSIYISLFGINSVSELNEMISTEILFQIFDRQKLRDTKIGKITKIIGKPALNIALKKLAINKDDLPLPSEITELIQNQNEKNFLFVFDDLERTSCNIKDILGFINSFIEQYKAKVLIIGDIDKLAKNKSEENITLNDDDNIELDNDQKLFSCYKEKLISFEINYNPNFNDIIISFVSSLFDINPINNYLDISKEELINILIPIFNSTSKKNLRTLQKFIFLLNELAKKLNNNKYEQNRFSKEYKTQFFIVNIIKISLKLFNMAFLYELPTITKKWEIKNDYSNFTFLEQFICSSVIQENELKKDIEIFINNREWEKTNINDPLLILKDKYYILDSHEELVEKYENIKSNINNYNFNKWGDILILISKLEDNELIKEGEFDDINSIFDQIVETTDWSENELEHVNFETDNYLLNDSINNIKHKDIIKKNFKKWEEIKENNISENKTKKIIEYFESNDMQGLKEYLGNQKNYFILKKELLGNIDFKNIKTFLEKSTAKLFQEFRSAIYQIYTENKVIKQPNEQKIIKKIINWCQDNLDENQDKIILMQKKWLIDNFERLLD